MKKIILGFILGVIVTILASAGYTYYNRNLNKELDLLDDAAKKAFAAKDFAKAEKSLLEIESKLQLNGTKEALFYVYDKLADLYEHELKNPTLAQQYYYKAEQLIPENAKSAKIANFYDYYSEFLMNKGELELAQKKILKEIEVLKALDDKQALFNVYHYAGNNYGNLSDYKKSEEMFALAEATLNEIEKAQQKKHWLNRAYLLNNHADALKDLGRYEQGIPLAKESIEILQSKKTEDKRLLSAAFDTLGALYLESKNYKEAESWLKKSLDEKHKVTDVKYASIAETLTNYAEALANLEKTVDACKNYNLAIENYKNAGNDNENRRISRIIKELNCVQNK